MIDSRYYDPDRTMERVVRAMRRRAGVSKKTVVVKLVEPDSHQPQHTAKPTAVVVDGEDEKSVEGGSVHAAIRNREGDY